MKNLVMDGHMYPLTPLSDSKPHTPVRRRHPPSVSVQTIDTTPHSKSSAEDSESKERAHRRHETLAYRCLSICQGRYDNHVWSQRQHQSSERQN
ncbi:hypothetical protein HCH54_010287 [Aspergillus fumigatus]